MGRPKRYATAAERNRAWRERRAAAGNDPKASADELVAKAKELRARNGPPAFARGVLVKELPLPLRERGKPVPEVVAQQMRALGRWFPPDGVTEVEFEGHLYPVYRHAGVSEEAYVAQLLAEGGTRDRERLRRIEAYARWRWRGNVAGFVDSLV